MNRELIRGYVAKVLNTRELVINRGEADGVQVGQIFAVLDPKTENIKDPKTGKTLGSIFRPKVRVKVTRVEERLSLARTFRKHTENVGGVGPDLGITRLFLPPEKVSRYETFKTDEATWEDIDESESFVKVGDPVEEVPPAEQEQEEPA